MVNSTTMQRNFQSYYRFGVVYVQKSRIKENSKALQFEMSNCEGYSFMFIRGDVTCVTPSNEQNKVHTSQIEMYC